MSKNLKAELYQYEGAELPTKVVDAPKGSVQFDKMVIVYSDQSQRTIRFVSLYDSRTDKFLARF